MSRPRSRLCGGLVTIGLLCAGLPGSAPAAKPFTLDPSASAAKPTIAVDSAGTAHVAWNLNNPGVADDTIVYCQVPRGKRSCSRKLTLAAPLDATSQPHVLLTDEGQVLVLSSRCCVGVSGYPTYLFRSADGGATFSAPLEIGNNEASGDAELGPGAFSVSTTSDVTTGGVTFQADPLSGPSPEHVVTLGEQPGTLGADYSGSIGFLDPLTPIVAMDDLDQVYFRRFGGGTAYNEIGGWGPLTAVGPGDEPELAGLPGGKKGVSVLIRVGTPGKFRLVARRFNGASFGAASTVSETGDPIFSSFFMDASGRLHAVWLANADNSLRHRFQPSGKGWQPAETLIGKGRADDVFDTRAAAAKDGGGFAVWDNNNAGPVRAVPFGPSGPGGGGGGGGGECVDEVKVGGATAMAQEGCLQQDPKDKSLYTTGGDVRLNGIDLVMGGSGGSSAAASAAIRLKIDTSARTLVSTGKVEARVGNVVLGRDVLQWKLPAGKGEIKDLAGNPAKFDTGQFHVVLLGLDVLGYTVPSIDGKEKVEIPINLELPAPFDSVLGDQASGAATLRATNEGGLKLSGLVVHLENISIGIALVKSFNLTYAEAENVFQGDTDILLPPAGAELGAAFGLRNGDFDYGRGEFTFPPGSLAVATDVLLRKIKFAVEKASTCDKPTKITGGVTLATGPEVAGTGLISVDGTVSYSFPRSSCGTPGILDVDGAGALAGLPVANLHSRFTTDGQFTFKTVVDVDLIAAQATIGVDGGIDIPSKTFYASGKGSVKALTLTISEADTIVSSTGMAVCSSATPIADLGFHYRWGETPGFDNFDFPSCAGDLDSYKPSAFARPSGAAVSAAGSFSLPGRLPSATVRLTGSGAAPGFTLKGPGLEFAYPSAAAGIASGKNYVVGPAAGQTFVKIQSPKAGSYTVSGAAGPAITGLAVAQGLPEPKVTGSVLRGRGRTRTLSFEARPIAGQKVIFVEQGKGVKNVLASTAQRRGVIHFRPAPGPAGRRAVLAIVTQDGIPRQQIKVARFVAPSSLPGRPQGVTLKRAGKKLIVSWKRVAGASRVAVAYSLADGRRQAEVGKGSSVVIPGVPGIDSGRIEVAGLRADNVAGRSVKVSLKAKPKRPHGKRRRGRR